jgi:small neutral amino acid transporter SnatA (MarC family)
MSFGLLLLGFVAAANPCRARLVLPRHRIAVALGALAALAVGAGLVALGRPLVDALDVSAESFRLAAGVVLAVEGARTLVWPRPAAEPELPGLGAALVPVAFPILLQPGVVVLALAAGGDRVEWSGVAALAVALALVDAADALPSHPLLVPGARVVGAVEILVGAALAISALNDV